MFIEVKFCFVKSSAVIFMYFPNSLEFGVEFNELVAYSTTETDAFAIPPVISSRNTTTPIIIPKEEVKKEIIPIEISEEIKEVCNYKISVSIPEHISFVEYDNIKGTVKNIGDCEIENLNIDISPELNNIIKTENAAIGNIGIGESVEFLLIKILETKESNLLIQGFNIRNPGENIITYGGILTFGAIVEENVVFEEKIDVKIDLLEESSLDIPGSKISIFVIVFLLLAVVFFVIFSKFSHKNKKLTQEQLDEIEEKVKKTHKIK